MTTLVMIFVFCSAALSLVSYVYCWNDIRSGRPHIISLRQITAEMDRNRLDDWFGRHERGYYYTLSPNQLEALMANRRWFFWRECAADAACMIGVWRYAMGLMDERFAGMFALLAALCQLVNLLYSLWLISKWHGQLREEIESSED